MGNTNLPQFGAADTPNSHDTREGAAQLTSEQIRQRDEQPEGGVNALLPGSVANESERAVVHADHGKNEIGTPRKDNATGASVAEGLAERRPDEADYAALAGHTGTGHSPSDAT